MYAAILTEKFEICIPKGFCEALGLKAGQKFIFVAKGNAVVMTPQSEVADCRGQFHGANLDGVRDRSDRHFADLPGVRYWPK